MTQNWEINAAFAERIAAQMRDSHIGFGCVCEYPSAPDIVYFANKFGFGEGYRCSDCGRLVQIGVVHGSR